MYEHDRFLFHFISTPTITPRSDLSFLRVPRPPSVSQGRNGQEVGPAPPQSNYPTSKLNMNFHSFLVFYSSFCTVRTVCSISMYNVCMHHMYVCLGVCVGVVGLSWSPSSWLLRSTSSWKTEWWPTSSRDEMFSTRLHRRYIHGQNTHTH